MLGSASLRRLHYGIESGDSVSFRYKGAKMYFHCEPVSYCRPRLKVRLKGDRVVVPPRSHARVQVFCEGYCDIDEEVEINVIAPRGESKKWRSGLRAAWGVCVRPSWIQVANFTTEPKVLLPGTTIAELHTVVGLGRRLATDPELEELELEQKEREGRRRVELERLEKRLFALQVTALTTANQGLRGASDQGMATHRAPGGDVHVVHSDMV